MKKRILSLTLVIVMLLSLIPFGIITATAEGTEFITKIEINDFNPQLYGGMTASQAKLECSYTLPDNAGYSKGNNNTYIINDGNTIYNNEKLIADKETIIHIEIYAMPFGVNKENPAYDFDGENRNNIEVWINGVLRTDVTVEGYNSAWRCVDVYIPVTVEEYTGETHTVTYNSNGGSDVAPEVVNDQFYAAEPEKPTKEGFVFDGWYADAELTQKFDFTNKITDDITLYAAWEEKIVAENITKIEINDFNPKLYNGMTASQAKLECSYTLPDNAGYCKGNNNTYIINGENTIYSNEKLSADKETIIHIEIYAMPFGANKENPTHDFDGESLDDIEVWINGVLRTDVTVEGYNSAWRCVDVYVPVEVAPITEIDSIEIEGILAPEFDQSILEFKNDSNEARENGTFKVNGNSGEWQFGNVLFDGWTLIDKDGEFIISDSSLVDAARCFEEGAYTMWFFFGPDEGYVFADDLTVTVKGISNDNVAVEPSEDGWIAVSVKFDVKGLIPIESLLVNASGYDLDLPVDGVTVTINNENIEFINDPVYGIFTDMDIDAQTCVPVTSGNFKADVEYWLVFPICAKEGYDISQITKDDITINGIDYDEIVAIYYAEYGILEIFVKLPKLSTSEPDPTYTVGDINGNGKIDARDYLLLKRAYFGTYTLNCAPEAADINGNGKIDARDYLLLKRAYFGTYTIK